MQLHHLYFLQVYQKIFVAFFVFFRKQVCEPKAASQTVTLPTTPYARGG